MRFTRQITLNINSDDAGTGRVFFDDNGQIRVTTTDSAFIAERVDGVLLVGASATVALPFGSVATAYAIMIESATELDLIFNGGAEVVKLRPGPLGRGVVYLESQVTQIQVTNTDAQAAAEVVYAVVGV